MTWHLHLGGGPCLQTHSHGLPGQRPRGPVLPQHHPSTLAVVTRGLSGHPVGL